MQEGKNGKKCEYVQQPVFRTQTKGANIYGEGSEKSGKQIFSPAAIKEERCER